MTELTFAILKYGFVIALWLFAWMVARSLHRDITAYLPSSKRARGKRKRNSKDSVMVGASNSGYAAPPVHVARDASAAQQQAAQPAPQVSPGRSAQSGQFAAVQPSVFPEGDADAPLSGDGEGVQSLANLAASVSGGYGVAGATDDANGSFDSPLAPSNGNDSMPTMAVGAGGAAGAPANAGAAPTLLIVIDGPLAGATVPLTGQPITLGRGTSNTVVLDDEFVSSSHARVFQDPSTRQWMLEDLNSTNGTYVNESRINGIMSLPARVPVRVGATTFELR
jgi:hypothetical protein